MKKINGPRLSRHELAEAKIRITTCLDKAVLEKLHELAHDSGGKYQTVLNQLLKNSLFGKREGLMARIARLEEAVFK